MRALFFLLFIIISSSMLGYSQQLVGGELSNFAGIYRVTTNPSAIVGTGYKWQANIGTVNSSISPRYFEVFGRSSMIYPIKDSEGNREMYGQSRTMGSLTDDGTIHVVSDLRLPSVLWNIGKNGAFAIQTRMRGFVQGEGIPDVMRTYYKDRMDTPKGLEGTAPWGDFHLRQVSFLELGFTYAHKVIDEEDAKLKIGITVKRIHSPRASSIKGNIESFSYNETANGESEATLHNFKYDIKDAWMNVGDKFLAGGGGLGLDAGLTFEIGKHWLNNDPSMSSASYIVRASASVTDIGRVNFYNTDVTGGQVSSLAIDQSTLNQIAADKGLAIAQMVGAEMTQLEPRMHMRLPKALRWDIDIQVLKSFFLNASGVKNMLVEDQYRPFNIGVRNYFSIAPRWEYEDADYSFPITFMEGKKGASVGFAARLSPVMIGFSNILGLVGLADHRSSYAYMGLSLYSFKSKDYRKKVKWRKKWD